MYQGSCSPGFLSGYQNLRYLAFYPPMKSLLSAMAQLQSTIQNENQLKKNRGDKRILNSK